MTDRSLLPAREVTDQELAEEARRVRRHAWRERGAMAAGMVVGFGGIAGWVATGTALVFFAGLALGSVLYGALRPKRDVFDEAPLEGVDASADVREWKRGERAAIAGRVGAGLLGRLMIAGGLVVGTGAGIALVALTHAPLRLTLIVGAVLGVTTGLVASWIVRRRVSVAIAQGLRKELNQGE